jgi:glycosyltransferase 2 family protein
VSLRKHVRWIVTVAILVMLILFARGVDWGEAWGSMRTASPWLLLAAFVANGASLVLRGIRWWIFLRPAGSPSMWLAVKAAIAGGALNNILLAQGGEAARVVFVSRASGVPSPRVLATLALERLFDFVAFFVLLAVGTAALPLPPDMQQLRVPAAVILVVAFVLLYLFVRFTRGHTLEAGAEAAAEIALGPSTLLARGRRFMSRFMEATRALATGRRFTWSLILSLIAWSGQLWTYHWCAMAIGISMPIAASLATLLASNLGFLVRLTPGSVGVFQVLYVVTAVQFGVGREAAVAASLLIQTLQIIPFTLIGVAMAPEFIFRTKVKAS